MKVLFKLAACAAFAVLAVGCASSDTASSARRQQQLYADIQKEMQAFEIRQQMDHSIREAEDSLRMPAGMSAVPDFR
jgi:hypothetical protein